ncbi:MAG: sialidase family protein [Candidatus Latescibacterota bacterium]|nr:sialidase family protein [Candidatus Latescibacterota bacterium]
MLEQKDIFVSGTSGYHTFRIPSLIAAKNGALLAFCEGRRDGTSDTGTIEILLRRSQDGGDNWSPIECVWADPQNTCGNPCPVVDETTGMISLLMTHNLGDDVESKIIDGTSKGTRTVRLSQSIDQGHTWSTPTDITSTTKKENWTWYATGPGAGIQIKTGRLVIPCDHIEAVSKKYYSHVILSDDGGLSWYLGGTTPNDQVNECEVAELPNGTLLLNMRNYDRKQRTRAYSYSEDGGHTWSNLTHHPELIEPICQASMRRISVENLNYLLFSNPANRESRADMTVRLSSDDGQTWSHSRLLHKGPAAYSCLHSTDQGEGYCLYECGQNNPYESIRLAHFDLTWLKT